MRPYLSRSILPLSLAAAVFLVALDGGAYALDSRLTLCIAVWWSLGVAVGLRLVPLARVPRAALIVLALLLALTAWTALSVVWADNDEGAVAEANRLSLYLAVAAAVVLVTRTRTAAAWSNGLALGLVAVAGLALASRFFPDVFDEPGLARLLPGAGQTRLSYPVNYWNGLAVLCALAVPLLLRAGLEARRALVAAAALAPLPAIAAVVFLASSRGGALTAAVGAALFVALTDRRYTALAGLLAGAAGSAVVVWSLTRFDELADDPRAPAAVGQGHRAAIVLAGACVGAAVLFGLARRIRAAPPRREVGWALVGLLLLVLVAGVVAADPRERFEAFKRPIEPGALTTEGHLLSGSSTGRWPHWNAALDQFGERPLTGGGAGSYEAWWAQHGEGQGFVSEAHSLYLETLGELGAVGFLLLIAALGVTLLTGWSRALRAQGEQRRVAAALAAAFTAYLVAAAIDWMWELTVVSLVAFAVLGLLVGPATREARAASRTLASLPVRLAAVALASAAVIAALLPLLADAQIRRSQREAARGATDGSIGAALRARALEPWASSPPLQLALVNEAAGDIPSARRWIEEAIERDPGDWRLRLAAARIATRAGETAEASRQLARARELNPRSPLFEDIG